MLTIQFNLVKKWVLSILGVSLDGTKVLSFLQGISNAEEVEKTMEIIIRIQLLTTQSRSRLVKQYFKKPCWSY